MSRRPKSKDSRTSPKNVPRAPAEHATDLRNPGRPVGEHAIPARRPGTAVDQPPAEQAEVFTDPPRPPPGPVIISGAQAAAVGEARAEHGSPPAPVEEGDGNSSGELDARTVGAAAAPDEEDEDADAGAGEPRGDGEHPAQDEAAERVPGARPERPLASPRAIDRDDLRLDPHRPGDDTTSDDDLDNTSLADEVDDERDATGR